MEKKITALETQKRNPDRLNVFLNDEFAFGISKFVGAWLCVGQSISQEKITELTRQGEREQAFQQALHFIGYKSRTIHEVKKKLDTAGFSPEIIEDVIFELKEKSYLDDQDFARQWAEIRSASKPRSRFLLALELKKKGVSEDVIHAALSSIPEDEALAFEFGKRYLRRLMNADQADFIKKMTSALQRKGFSYQIAANVAGNLEKQRLLQNEK
jgi:regulatory protein